MSTDTRTEILAILARIAPEIDIATLPGSASLRDELDIDSMDVLNFAIALSRRFGMDIPQSDYPRLATVDDCVAYVEGASSTRRAGGELGGRHGDC